MTEAKFNPVQLRKARMMRGISMAQLAEQAELSRQSISKYEQGTSEPRGDSILKMAHALNFPTGWFSRDEATAPMGAVFFRSQAASTNKLREMQTMRLQLVAEAERYLSEYIDFPEVNIPTPLDVPVEEITDDMIREMSESVRDLWQLGTGPIGNLTNVLEANGIIVSETTMHSEKLDAVSSWISGRPVIALTDNDESAARRRFNMAHELGHILLHESVEDIFELDNAKYKKLLERQAHYFASSLLLPDDSFMDYLISTDMSFFIEAKQYWKVSISALIYKASQLHLMTENQYLYLQKKISSNHWRKHEPDDDVIPKERPELFKEATEMLIEAKVTDSAKISSDLGFPKEEFETIFRHSLIDKQLSKAPKLRIVR
ncbi:helix-turn-helix domain-containing protein [Lacticaseibacillus sp. GG6-2]